MTLFWPYLCWPILIRLLIFWPIQDHNIVSLQALSLQVLTYLVIQAKLLKVGIINLHFFHKYFNSNIFMSTVFSLPFVILLLDRYFNKKKTCLNFLYKSFEYFTMCRCCKIIAFLNLVHFHTEYTFIWLKRRIVSKHGKSKIKLFWSSTMRD